MNLRTFAFLSMTLLLLNAGCQQNPTEPTATKTSSVSGTVFDADNNPLALARVIDRGSIAKVDTSKTDGSYKLTMELSSNYTTSIYAILSGYASDTLSVSLTPGDTLTNKNIHMVITDSSKIVNGKSGRPVSIGLLSQSTKSILLKGGINQSCTLIFLVVDSINRPVTGSNKCKVKFSISVSNPSGESIKPDTGETDPLTGQVSTTVFSGTKPNAILVTAQVIDPTRKIAATAGLTEGTGLPDGSHVSITASKYNIAGRVYDGLSTTIAMALNDQFGNPVPDGTPVIFVTNGGGITSNAFTSNGIATATLTSGGGNPPIGGLVTVTAETKGDTSVRKADSSIVRTIQILFSGQTTVARSSNTINFEVPDGDMNYFDFTVSDDYGKPLVAGTTISVTATAATNALQSTLQLTGSQITMPDTKDTNQTHFRIWVIDKVKDSLSGVLTFKINITSPNGNYPSVDQTWFTGFMRGATNGGGFYGVPASIALADSSIRQLYLSETQLPDTSTRVSFIVKDGSGTPISVTRKALVTFSLFQAPSGTHLSTNQDSTGAGGSVTVTISAGNVPGIAQIVARTTDGLGNFFSALSMPIQVAHGLPDSNQIFISLPQNMFNNMGNLVGTLKINLADVNGNFPAPEFVQFSTSGGVISPIAAVTDVNGSASTGLYGGKVPADPTKGFGNVSAILKVHGGGTVIRKAPFLFSGAPVITTLDVPSSDTIIIYDAGLIDLNYTVADANGNSLASGNSIQVSVSGYAAPSITLTNASNVTSGTTDPNSIYYRVRLADAVPNGGISGNFDVYISVNGTNGSATRHFYGVLRAVNEITSSPEVKVAAQIAYIGSSASDIYVSDVGALNNATITYEVRDSLGLPVAASPRYAATYSINFYPNSTIGGGTYPKAIPSVDSTDSQGRLHVSVVSGTEAGVIQLVAQIVLGSGKIILSQPVKISVHSGFPDQNHFTIMAGRFVFPGWDFLLTPYPTFTVAVGDTFSNPVNKGTAVYFHSQAGIIETGYDNFTAYTDANGLATVNFLTVNPRPVALTPYCDLTALSGRQGGFWVYAQTQSRGGNTIIDSVLVVMNKWPIIIVQAPSLITMPMFGSSALDTLEVTDANGNPLCDGTTITASFVIPAGASGVAFDTYGAIPITIPIASAARFPGWGTTKFLFGVTDNSTTGVSSTTCKITISAPGLGSVTVAIPVALH